MKSLLEKYNGCTFIDAGSPALLEGPVASIQEKVYERIRDRILTGVLESGQLLQQDELAAEMGISVQQVRDALLQLAGEGLVTYEPDEGFSVAVFTLDDLEEIYFLRSLLEGSASELAARNITEPDLDKLGLYCRKMEEILDSGDLTDMPGYNAAFHQVIYQAARSPRLYRMIVGLWNGFLKASLACLTLRAKETVEEHKAIYQALRGRNPEEARVKTQEHIVSVLGALSLYWGNWLK